MTTRLPPHARLLELLRGAIRILPEGTHFRGEHTYIDLFGATLANPMRTELSDLAGEWIEWLEREKVEPIYALLVPKSGNVLLAEAVAARQSTPMRLIVAKDQDDKSRVSVDGNDDVSPVNFEGLTECIAGLDAITHPKKRIVAFDDSCRNGGTLRKAIEDLNRLVANEPDQYPFELVRDIVVLFRRGSPSADDQLSGGLALQALLMCDDSVIQRLHRLPSPSALDLERLGQQLLDQMPVTSWLSQSRKWHTVA